MRIDALAVFILVGAGHVRGFPAPCPTAFRVDRERARNGWNAETAEIAEKIHGFLRVLCGLCVKTSFFSVESVDSRTATVDNQAEMFLATASLVLISVGINLPTVTG